MDPIRQKSTRVQCASQMLHEDRERAGVGVLCGEGIPDIAFVIECQQHRNPEICRLMEARSRLPALPQPNLENSLPLIQVSSTEIMVLPAFSSLR